MTILPGMQVRVRDTTHAEYDAALGIVIRREQHTCVVLLDVRGRGVAMCDMDVRIYALHNVAPIPYDAATENFLGQVAKQMHGTHRDSASSLEKHMAAVRL